MEIVKEFNKYLLEDIDITRLQGVDDITLRSILNGLQTVSKLFRKNELDLLKRVEIRDTKNNNACADYRNIKGNGFIRISKVCVDIKRKEAENPLRIVEVEIDSLEEDLKNLYEIKNRILKGVENPFILDKGVPNKTVDYFDSYCDKITCVFYHEAGHHLHKVCKKGTAYRNAVKELQNIDFDDYKKPSVYANKDFVELFADSFALYMMGKKDLIDEKLLRFFENLN